ncbi:hypothetical protein HUE87_07530 [Candidatus Sulfurimonas marisnigri]|uniref:Bacterial DNA polymerase III alpha subunit NTPase domain-containing protein n=1 Tax=Candidatus Sulfurimonas marisnigri TaxID=2740405 RepID=A0A7S7LYJ5_9BACT|nr:hypothetical protein [Candidatus Sulfurimonas marisnigri]QOY53752.1 hypothetical protein HUE87_07530 [Candidatus Sulfurimonas marisnigri]
MSNKYHYKAYKEGLLQRMAIQGLREKIDPSDENYAEYEKVIKKEISTLEKIKFDGYMLLLADVVLVSREISGFVSCFGSIQNSLTAFVLDIVDVYEFDKNNFKNFTPFAKKPVVNILISSYANGGCVGYIKHKYPDLIKKVKKRTIIFNDDLIIKFIDLGIEIKVKETQE